jgi:hypothetical protein
MALPSSSGEPTLLGPIDRASLYRWTETLWLQNVKTMDKVQRMDRSNSTNVLWIHVIKLGLLICQNIPSYAAGPGHVTWEGGWDPNTRFIVVPTI